MFVGLSGGVDSSVAALRLLQAGYDVVGVFIKVWHPDWMVCNWEDERRDAMRVAAKLGIPFLTCDAEAAYYDSVASYFVEAYAAGETPNPDVMCNQHVKFGAFLDYAIAHGAAKIATGHYAQVITDPVTNAVRLTRGIDDTKDQSYFLWTVTSAQLQKTLLPIGGDTKEQIRAEAAAAGLDTAHKKDSQGICFLGHVDMYDFLSRFIELIPGDVITPDGVVIGTHRGAPLYTVGQRHGFTISHSEYAGRILYVHEKNISSNTLTVSSAAPSLHSGDQLVLRSVNLTASIAMGDVVSVQVRYRQTPISATVTHQSGDHMVLTLSEAVSSAAVGQSCVLYDKVVCLGGGIIAECRSS